MAAPLEACVREEQRAVTRFLGSEGEKPADIHRRMKRQYGDACVSLQQVYEWHRKFKSGVSTVPYNSVGRQIDAHALLGL
jgi:hypothetical protein